MNLELKIARFESLLTIGEDHVTTLEIEDRQLFTRVVRSLISGEGIEAEEPYQFWMDGKKISSKRALTIVENLPRLPLTDKSMLSLLYKKIVLQINDNIETSDKLKTLAWELENSIEEATLNLWGDYGFNLQWDPTLYLKAFAFQPDSELKSSLLDNCIRLFGLCADISFDKAIVLINAKSFFSESELTELFSQAFFFGISLLLLESWHDEASYELERKTRIDRDFIEFQ